MHAVEAKAPSTSDPTCAPPQMPRQFAQCFGVFMSLPAVTTCMGPSLALGGSPKHLCRQAGRHSSDATNTSDGVQQAHLQQLGGRQTTKHWRWRIGQGGTPCMGRLMAVSRSWNVRLTVHHSQLIECRIKLGRHPIVLSPCPAARRKPCGPPRPCSSAQSPSQPAVANTIASRLVC